MKEIDDAIAGYVWKRTVSLLLVSLQLAAEHVAKMMDGPPKAKRRGRPPGSKNKPKKATKKATKKAKVKKVPAREGNRL
jgi:hypothetical protein